MKTLTKPTLIDYLQIQRELAIRNAQNNFYSFCQLLYPEFYKPDRTYLKELCDALQDFYDGVIDKHILIINMPPRHGKTFTATLFVVWMYGKDLTNKIMTGAYNQTLSQLFAQQTRDMIMTENENAKQMAFSDVFPDVKIKQGDAAKGFWSLAGTTEKSYLATSPGGTSTGIGAKYLLIDDAIKSAEDAYNQRVLDDIWHWYNNTLMQRLEAPRKQIVIMTRWASGDLAGKLIESRPDDVHVVTFKAIQDDGTMLSEEILSYEDYLHITKEMGKDIAEANYQQTPIDLEDQLYTTLKTYDPTEMPEFVRIFSYTDTADEGSDYLATFIAGETADGEAYILDIYYTQDSMETTEPEQAYRLIKFDTNIAFIESNSGGRGYARSVRRIMKEDFDWNKTVVKTFHQSKNKIARILSNATWIMNHVYFPNDWSTRWPEAYLALIKFQRKGKNKNDDLPDALTGIAERINARGGVSVLK